MDRNIQILVIGSAFDTLTPNQKNLSLAQEVGKLTAELGGVLMYGAEPDVNSYPTVAAKAAKEFGGISVAFPPNSSKELFDPSAASVICPLSVDRGGQREALLSRMGDVVILIGGGSGGATEALSAYQGHIPLICIKGSGGWADRLLEKPIDERHANRDVVAAESAQEAISLSSNFYNRKGDEK